ncbi:MAG: hypothetical protein ACI841_001501 [Planctomycetota bacterium]|jgi:hypothetical protein
MDLENFWQENKRFLSIVFGGVIVFFIALAVIDGTFGSESAAVNKVLRTSRNALSGTARYSKSDETAAFSENEALMGAVGTLSKAVAFQPRPEFVLDDRRGSPEGQYFGRVDEVRSDLETLSGRRGMRIPEGLGLAMLETNSAEAIERHMEALDLIDRVLRMSLETGVKRVDRVGVRLDPGFSARGGLGEVERTSVELKIVSSPESIVELIDKTQAAEPYGHALVIDELEVTGAKAKSDEVTAVVKFLVIRLRETEKQGD